VDWAHQASVSWADISPANTCFSPIGRRDVHGSHWLQRWPFRRWITVLLPASFGPPPTSTPFVSMSLPWTGGAWSARATPDWLHARLIGVVNRSTCWPGDRHRSVWAPCSNSLAFWLPIVALASVAAAAGPNLLATSLPIRAGPQLPAITVALAVCCHSTSAYVLSPWQAQHRHGRCADISDV